MGSLTTNFSLYKPDAGETGWTASINSNFDTIDSNLTNSLPRAYLSGLALSNNTGTPTTHLDIAAGVAQDIGNAGAMTLASVLTKNITASWAVGTGNGGLGSGVTRAVNTWYHVFLIKRTDTNVVDAYFDTSVSAANIPSPYTLFRRLGSFRTDGTGSGNIIAFFQNGDTFLWDVPVSDFSAANPGTAAVDRTLTVPTGVRVHAIASFSLVDTAGAATQALITAKDTADTAPSTTLFDLRVYSTGGIGTVLHKNVLTDTSAVIRTRLSASSATHTIAGTTFGWIDRRGRDA